MAKAPADARSVEQLRTDRDAIHAQIEKLKERARDLTEKIRAKEPPIPDRGSRKTGFRVEPAAS